MQEKRWSLIAPNPDKVSSLQTALQIHPLLCQLLVQRGIETWGEAKDFFRPDLAKLPDPFLMKNMDKAVARINQALAKKERILIYGDYDVDGTTAVATVFTFFKEFTDQIEYYIPHRYTEGYGISEQGVLYAAQQNCKLIIALDCGIKSNDKVDLATSKGIDFIICDHHLPGEEIPAAVAVLDPKQKDCAYPYKELSGCGIGFKLIQAYSQFHQLSSEKIFDYLDLLAVSIASDIVPITGENRILAFHGLKKLQTNPSQGMRTLLEVSGLKDAQLDISKVVFGLGPRINAAGRMDDAKHAVKLLIGDESALASLESARVLQEFNLERRDLDKTITQEALTQMESNPNLANLKSTVVYDPNWHKGVIGIVASRLTESYYRPTLVLTLSDNKITGSARSIKGFNLYEAIYACREHLIQFGGHQFAAGLTMLPENLEAFNHAFEKIAQAQLTPEDLIPTLDIDLEISLKDITPQFFKIVEQMAPFGPGNMKPTFMAKNVKDTGWSKLVKEEHIKFSLQNPHVGKIDGIGFGMKSKFPLLKKGLVDICFQLEENEWQGMKSIQLIVKDMRGAG